MKHFTVVEVDPDCESPMIGTIDNVIDNINGSKLFKERLIKALSEHFDSESIECDPIPDLFAGSPYEEVEIRADDFRHYIRILETWIY